MLWLVSLLYWKVSVSAALKFFVSCPKRICAWWADVADIASSVTFSDGNVSAVCRPLYTFNKNPSVTVGGFEQHPVSPTHTLNNGKRKYSASMACHCMQHRHISTVNYTVNYRPTLPSVPIISEECWHAPPLARVEMTMVTVICVCVCVHTYVRACVRGKS